MTYNNDTTFIDSEKDCAAWSYQKLRQMSGMIGSFAELGMINTVDYRPGNRSPQDGIYNQLRKAIAQAKYVVSKGYKIRALILRWRK